MLNYFHFKGDFKLQPGFDFSQIRPQFIDYLGKTAKEYISGYYPKVFMTHSGTGSEEQCCRSSALSFFE